MPTPITFSLPLFNLATYVNNLRKDSILKGK